MGVCDTTLAMNIESSCGVKKGMRRLAKLLNRKEISNLTTFNYQTTKLITTITMKSGAKAHKVSVPGTQPFEGLSQNLEVGTYDKTFTTDVPIVVLKNDPATAAQLKQIANGEFVLIVENVDYSGHNNGRYQVYGWEVGLRVSAITREPYGDNPGWAITLHEEGASNAAIFASEDAWNALTLS